MKKVKDYLGLNYPVTISKDIDNGKIVHVAEIPDLPGCRVQGSSFSNALKSLEEAKKLWIKVSLKKGLDIPEPANEDEFSGKLLLRIPAKLHMLMTQKAKNEGLSLNQLIRTKLESSLSIEAIQKEVLELKVKIDELCLRSVMDAASGTILMPFLRREIEEKKALKVDVIDAPSIGLSGQSGGYISTT